MLSRRTRGFVVLVAVFLLGLLTACRTSDSGGTAGAGDAPASAGAPPMEDGGVPPAQEGGGTEKPQGGGDGGVAIEVAGLPMGGQADDETIRRQCVRVSWLGQEDSALRDGITARVTGSSTDNDQFRVAGFGCAGAKCDSFVFRSADDACYVAVDAGGEPFETADLTISGEIRCSAEQRQECRAFARGLREQTINITAPDIEDGEDSGKDENPGGDDGGSPPPASGDPGTGGETASPSVE